MKDEIRFIMKGQAYFYAKNIDDALKKLGNHFIKLSTGKESFLFDSETDYSIHPTKKQKF